MVAKRIEQVSMAYAIVAIVIFGLSIISLLPMMAFSFSYSQGNIILDCLVSIWIACAVLFIVGIVPGILSSEK